MLIKMGRHLTMFLFLKQLKALPWAVCSMSVALIGYQIAEEENTRMVSIICFWKGVETLSG